MKLSLQLSDEIKNKIDEIIWDETEMKESWNEYF